MTVTGMPVEPTMAEQVILQGITGATAGMIAMMIVGFRNPK
jgi:hypothetical protein